MQTYSLQRSAIDPDFLEISLQGIVIQEVRVHFEIPKSQVSFSSLDEVLAWLGEIEYKQAKAYAYRLLSRRSYSKYILLKKLKEKKYGETKCQKVIGEIEQLGYLSDEDVGEMAVSQKIKQGYGPQYIERYLQELGLDPRLARQNMDVEKQREAIKKWDHKLHGKEKKKRIAFLIRRGFDFNVIQNLCV